MVGKPIVPVQTFPSNILTFDVALGCGGIPLGRMGEIFGPESSGKTTFCLQVVGACQKHKFDLPAVKIGGKEVYPAKKRNGVAAYIDMEHAVDPVWAAKVGVDFEKLVYAQPSHGEEAMEIARQLALSNEIDIIIIDSVASLIPKAELEGEITDHNIAGIARMLGKSTKQLRAAITKSRCVVLFINQLRDKPGVMFGNPEVTPGGRAVKFASDFRVDIRKGSQLKEGEIVYGFESHCTIVKNKMSRPYTKANLQLAVGTSLHPVHGIDTMLAMLRVGTDIGVISQTGSSFSYKDARLGMSMRKSSIFLHQNPEIAATIRDEIYGKIAATPIADTFDVDDEVESDETDSEAADASEFDLEE